MDWFAGRRKVFFIKRDKIIIQRNNKNNNSETNFNHKYNENQTKIIPNSSEFVATPKFFERFFTQLQQGL